jgi:large subunit ribosomal protein L29
MKIEKLKAKTTEELVTTLNDKRVKLHNYELELKSGKEKDTGKVKVMRRDIARILTLLNQKSLEQLPTEEKKEEVK